MNSFVLKGTTLTLTSLIYQEFNTSKVTTLNSSSNFLIVFRAKAVLSLNAKAKLIPPWFFNRKGSPQSCVQVSRTFLGSVRGGSGSQSFRFGYFH